MNNQITIPSPSESPPGDLQPVEWWRRPCPVTDRIFVCGDLPQDPGGFAAHLDEWVRLGVTHIVDVREEWSDEPEVLERHPHIEYAHLGTHDSGGSQSSVWFDRGVAAMRAALADPEAKVLVHCHMGVNRAPSLVYAALLTHGVDIEEGLYAIRAARPIAAILYAESAIRWIGALRGWSAVEVSDAVWRVRFWHSHNEVDVEWIISGIRQAERGQV
jgi:protein tyrosine phosphatase (PTP) superfamily phosphohydrolase (DUF442 family)